MDVYLLNRGPQNQNWRNLPRLRLSDYSEDDCRKKLRLPKHTVQEIADVLYDDLKPASSKNNPIHPDTQVVIALRILASGSFQVNVKQILMTAH